ncbi:MAG TPA: hypothetical protein P5244_01255 [Syntrophales bacterium]|nr:hypothetical protein [Syntrophales bacterium]
MSTKNLGIKPGFLFFTIMSDTSLQFINKKVEFWKRMFSGYFYEWKIDRYRQLIERIETGNYHLDDPIELLAKIKALQEDEEVRQYYQFAPDSLVTHHDLYQAAKKLFRFRYERFAITGRGKRMESKNATISDPTQPQLQIGVGIQH